MWNLILIVAHKWSNPDILGSVNDTNWRMELVEKQKDINYVEWKSYVS